MRFFVSPTLGFATLLVSAQVINKTQKAELSAVFLSWGKEKEANLTCKVNLLEKR